MDLQPLFDDGDERVGGDYGPNLRFHGVLSRAVELLDPKMLLDPLEWWCDLPSALVQLGDRKGLQDEVLRQEHGPLAGLGVVERKATQRCLEVLAGIEAAQNNCLVADPSGTASYGTRRATVTLQIRLATGHEDSTARMKPIEPREIEVYPVHDVKGRGFRQELVGNADAVHLAVADVDKCRNIAAHFEQRVQLHGNYRRVKQRRAGDGKTKIDSRCVQHVDRLFGIHAKRLVKVQLSSRRNRAQCERRIDTPVARLVRIRERAARKGTSYFHMIKLVVLRLETRVDVSNALAVGELCDGGAEKML